MSLAGQIQRGSVWFKFKDVNGNYPKEIVTDEVKMSDLKIFLENQPKPKEVKEKKEKK